MTRYQKLNRKEMQRLAREKQLKNIVLLKGEKKRIKI